MSLVEKIKELTNEKKISIAELERKVGISNGQIRKWDSSKPSIDKLQTIADYFNVSTDYLLGRTEDPYWKLTDKAEKDIQNDLESMIEGLNNDDSLTFMKNCDSELSEDDAALLRASMEYNHLDYQRSLLRANLRQNNTEMTMGNVYGANRKRNKKIIRKSGSSNPFKIAKYLKVGILYHHLPHNIKGYSTRYRRMKCVILNEQLSEPEACAVLCHELGHSIMHQKTNTVFFEHYASTTVISKLEHEANCFMFLLLKENTDLESIKSKHNYIQSIGMPCEMVRYIDLLW